jgi:extracellular factor (EF) 3-hydroxypalmitic acid methyl ester biosynthesis protein
MKSFYKSSADIENAIQKIVNLYIPSNNFDAAIVQIENYLSAVKTMLDVKEPKILEQNIKIDKKFILDNFLPLITHLSFLVEQLFQYLSDISKEQFLLYQKVTKEKLDKFFMSAPFPNRAFTKPLGFAGDYKMMYMIQEQEDEGDSIFSKLINVYYTNIPISNSVKNRTDTLVNYIEQAVNNAKLNNNNEVKILSVGCGPALEVRNYLQKNNPEIKCNFNLLDFNTETLEFAKKHSSKPAEDKNYQINLIEKSVYNLMNYNNFSKVLDGKCDLIYCAGLFDYLSDKLCKKLVGFFYNSLNEGGRLLVTNMHQNNNDKYLMELLLDWHLIYRNEDDVIRFADGLGKYKTFIDSTGINLCLEIEKK